MYNTGEFVCVCLYSRLDRDLDRNPASRWRLAGTTHGVGKVIDKTGVFVFLFFLLELVLFWRVWGKGCVYCLSFIVFSSHP